VHRNPLVFDNRFDPEGARRSGSRVVASLTAPPAQRAQVARLADSPHTFVVILLDEASEYYDGEALEPLSQSGCITLVLSLSEMKRLDFRSLNRSLPKSAGLSRFSAFVLLHRMGDVLYPGIRGTVFYPHEDLNILKDEWNGPAATRLYFPGEVSDETRYLASRVSEASRVAEVKRRANGGTSLASYIVAATNSQMAREGLHDPTVSDDRDRVDQYIADWVALSEMPSARARPGRSEPWLLFPPKPGMYTPEDEERLRQFSESINADFPPFIQSLLDDLDGAVIRL